MNKLSKMLFWGVVLLGLLGAMLILVRRSHSMDNIAIGRDASTIGSYLEVPTGAISCERLVIDDYRNYYCTYFFIPKINMPIKANVINTLFDYKRESVFKDHIYLHKTQAAKLKVLKWGPIEKFSRCDEYVGLWGKDLLVYLAVCDDGIWGYFENNYSEPPGAGPFR
jgi:hypothetical protein